MPFHKMMNSLVVLLSVLASLHATSRKPMPIRNLEADPMSYVPGDAHNNLIAESLANNEDCSMGYAYRALKEITATQNSEWVTSLANSPIVPVLISEVEKFDTVRNDSTPIAALHRLSKIIAYSKDCTEVIKYGPRKLVELLDRILGKVPKLTRFHESYYNSIFGLISAILDTTDAEHFIPHILQGDIIRHAIKTMRRFDEPKMISSSRKAMAVLRQLAASDEVVLYRLVSARVIKFVNEQLEEPFEPLFKQAVHFIHDIYQAYDTKKGNLFSVKGYVLSKCVSHPNHKVSSLASRTLLKALRDHDNVVADVNFMIHGGDVAYGVALSGALRALCFFDENFAPVDVREVKKTLAELAIAILNAPWDALGRLPGLREYDSEILDGEDLSSALTLLKDYTTEEECAILYSA